MLAAQYGGAMFVWHGSGSTRIVDCTFELNVAGAWGGAVYALERSGATTIVDCVFQRNRAPSVRTHRSRTSLAASLTLLCAGSAEPWRRAHGG